MLYSTLELMRQAMQPVHFMAEAGQASWASLGGFVRFIPGAAEACAACALLERLTKEYEKPRFNISETQIAGKRVEVVERVVLAQPFGQLLHFDKPGANKGPQVLLVAPLSGHHATLLRPTVEALLPDHDVYITDWTDARYVPVEAGRFNLGDYAQYVREFLTFLGPDTHVVAVCQPTVPVLATVALMAEDQDPNQPRSMTLIAGPIDTRENPTQVNAFALAHDMAWFRQRVIETVPFGYPGIGRQVYPGFLQLAGFVSMNVDRHIEAHLGFYKDVAQGNVEQARKHEHFYDEYNAVLDLSAEYYLETIEKVFREHHLPRAMLELNGRRVNPASIARTALQTIEGGKDDITGLGQTRAAHALCSSLSAQRRQHLVVEGVGHYGTFSGSKFRESILPAIAGFIRNH